MDPFQTFIPDEIQPEQPKEDVAHTENQEIKNETQTENQTENQSEPTKNESQPSTEVIKSDSIFNFSFWSSSTPKEEVKSDPVATEPVGENDTQVTEEDKGKVTKTDSIFNFSFWSSSSNNNSETNITEGEKKNDETTAGTENGNVEGGVGGEVTKTDSIFDFSFWTNSINKEGEKGEEEEEVEIALFSDGESTRSLRRRSEMLEKQKENYSNDENNKNNSENGEGNEVKSEVKQTTSIFDFSFWTSSSNKEENKEEKEEKKEDDQSDSSQSLDSDNETKKQENEAKKPPNNIPLLKEKIANNDVNYIKENLSILNMRMEVVPRYDGTGAHYTPLGWAIYHNARESVTFLLSNPKTPVDPTSVVARSYLAVLPDMLMKSAFIRRMAPSQVYEKTEYSCNALDLAVILGRKEILEEILNLQLAWNRKFHDPLGYALDLSKTFFGWTSGRVPFDSKEVPREIKISTKEQANYQAMIDLLKTIGANDTVDDDIWENSHWILSVFPPHEEFDKDQAITEFKIPTNTNSVQNKTTDTTNTQSNTNSNNKDNKEVNVGTELKLDTLTINNNNNNSSNGSDNNKDNDVNIATESKLELINNNVSNNNENSDANNNENSDANNNNNDTNIAAEYKLDLF